MKFLSSVMLCILLAGCVNISKILKNPDPEYKLRMAEQFFVKEKYHYAQQLYEDVIPFYRGTPEFEDIYYKYAYTAYYQQDYLNAENLFKNFVEVFPNSAKAEEIDYMRAYAFYKQSPKAELDQTNTLRAIALMQAFINTHPGSARNQEATAIIDELRLKLEVKDAKAAQLYYDMGQFRAAATAFNNLLSAYPDTQKGDTYKMMAIRSYFRFAELSVEEKKAERFEKVIEECNDFVDRFPESGFGKEVQEYLTKSQNILKTYNNEPAQTST